MRELKKEALKVTNAELYAGESRGNQSSTRICVEYSTSMNTGPITDSCKVLIYTEVYPEEWESRMNSEKIRNLAESHMNEVSEKGFCAYKYHFGCSDSTVRYVGYYTTPYHYEGKCLH